MKKSITGKVAARRARRVAGAIMALLACAVVAPTLAQASQYWVEECSEEHPAAPDAKSIGDSSLYVATDDCANAGLLEIRASQTATEAQPREARQWHYQAPAGTEIASVLLDFGLISGSNDHVVSLFVMRSGETGQERLTHFSGGGILTSTFDSELLDLGALERIGVRISCPPAGTDCDYAPGVQARMNTARFLINDQVPPSVPEVSGPGASGEWLSGAVKLKIDEQDQGAGISRTLISANGSDPLSFDRCEVAVDAEGRVGTMKPCPAVVSEEESIDTRTGDFEDGTDNELLVCSEEYGTDPARRCRAVQLSIDNVAPQAPQALTIAGGNDWRRDNDFDLSWNNPTQDHSPIAGAVVQVSGPGGYLQEHEYEGRDIDEINNLHVPEPGEYQAHVYLVDDAGNVDPTQAASVPLRFDNTVPPGTDLNRANGWLSRDDLRDGYLQRWAMPPESSIPPSGVAGYRFVVDQDPDSDPCAGARDPRTCGQGVTHVGVSANSELLTADELKGGSNWAHVVTISGSGMRGVQVDHVEIKVDLNDPEIDLDGWSGGWASTPVRLKATAFDTQSGMDGGNANPGQELPRTALEIDGETVEENDAEVEALVSGEGVHRIRFWARDLAGNENDGIGDHNPPGEATVRIDTSPPVATFENRQDPADPDRLEVQASDALSGLRSAEIAYRSAGGAWMELPTKLSSGRAVARVDSELMEASTEYEFRARVRDRAGNETVTTSRADGSPMRVVGPLRGSTSMAPLRIEGRRRARIAQHKRGHLTGRLRVAGGSTAAAAKVRIVEKFASGARRHSRERVVRTRSDGRFTVRLGKGPSRSVTARFEGDRRYLGSSSNKARLGVRSRITLRAPRRSRAGRRVTFRGRVRAPGARVRGKRIEVQVRVGRRWKAVGRSLRARRGGKFRLRYRFVAAYRRPVHYRFRAVALRERGFPYLPAKSAQRRLTVRP